MQAHTHTHQMKINKSLTNNEFDIFYLKYIYKIYCHHVVPPHLLLYILYLLTNTTLFFLSLSLKKKKKPKNQETKTNHKALQRHRIKSQTQANGQ